MNLLNLKTLLAAAVVASGLALAAPASAGCHDDYAPAYTPVCTWKTVITYETRQVEEFVWVTKYDSYGNPYRVKVLSYKTITVPVEKLVKVCY